MYNIMNVLLYLKNKFICCLTLFLFVILRQVALEAKSYAYLPGFWKLDPNCMSWNSAVSSEDMECIVTFNILILNHKRSQNLKVYLQVIDFAFSKKATEEGIRWPWWAAQQIASF